MRAPYLFIALVLFGQNASAGLFDRMKDKAQNLAGNAKNLCQDAAAAGVNKAAQIKDSSANMARFGAEVQKTFEKLPSLANQFNDLACLAGECSVDLTKTVAASIPGAIYRVWQFEGSLDDVRTGIVVPLMGHIRHLRLNKENPQELAKTFARLLVFSVEATFKLQTALSYQLEVNLVPSGAGGLLALPSIENPPVQDDLLKQFMLEVFNSIRSALLQPSLTWQQRFDAMLDTEKLMNNFILRVADQLGWKDIQVEIQHWVPEK